MNVKLKIFFLISGLMLALFTGGCGSQDKTGVIQNKPDILKDKPLAYFQRKLIDIAFDTATAIPIKPHIKDRSRAQEAVVMASLELNQPRRALNYIEKIGNWRRGAGYGALAFYCAQHDCVEMVPYCLDIADQISKIAEDWRKDIIRVKIAKTHAYLGQTRQADEFEKDVVDSEIGKVAGVKAMIAYKDSFDEQMKAMDELIAMEHFDVIKNTLTSCVELFDRFYDEAERRSFVEEKIKASWGEMPIFIRVEILIKLAGSALDHEDQIKALNLINEAQLFMDNHQWPSEYRVRWVSKLCGLRFRAGDKVKAREEADALLILFDAEKAKIMNIYRAETLHPLAEAYQMMGDTKSALKVYKKAVEESIENPNSRPRAEDLSATTLSMALHGVKPDAELWNQIFKSSYALGDPW